MLDLRVITGDNLKTSLGGTQFGVNLQANTTACEHLSVDENTSPEDRLGEDSLTPARQMCSEFKPKIN